MRRTTLAEFTEQTYDILIIGGGITGAAALRDAALRGLKVALIEKNDFAWGTSSRSTKLLHGGLRYLERFEFKMVREACRERELMLQLAPHLAHPRPFLYLQYQGYPEGMLKLRAGLTIYDLFSGNPGERRHKMLNRDKLLAIEPHLNPDGLKGCGYYFDFLTDDARLTIETMKGGCEAGAHVANYMEAVGFVMENGRVAGAQVHDHITNQTGEIRARQLINCGGPWVDKVRFMEDGVQGKRLRPTKGVHIVLSKKDFPLNHAVFLRSPSDNRVVWPIPALDSDLVYVGTTDTDYDGPLDNVVATEEDIDYLLEVANHTIPGRNLGREHIIGTWAGLRPLISPEDARNASAVSREHEIFTSPNGLLTIGGGKLTTARVMGQQVVDKAVELLSSLFSMTGIHPSNSQHVPVSGGSQQQMAEAQQKLAELRLETAVQKRLVALYGGNALKIAAMIETDPEAAASMGGHNIIAAEVQYAVKEEMAQTITDFFTRRASLFYWLRDGGLGIADAVGAEMGRLLDWDAMTQMEQNNNYRDWVAENRFEPALQHG
ncbi:glycerol-3-phosphate dehydrogenase/oxidase [Candidatus Leptofilum sp.]|uniref:glycerol-3-phosphate dehydrogenase/oxidase n=1 Tax=Candidatus Leptofilum sp. TaxID=3241576 RepID=UPI003B599EF8